MTTGFLNQVSAPATFSPPISLSFDDLLQKVHCTEFFETHFKDPNSVRPKVLVVDDERLLADTTAAILRSAGFDSKPAYNAREALQIVESFRPDYLLTDIMMPLMNGLELAIMIAGTYPGTKILLTSGQAGVTNIVADGKDRGFEFPLIPKPSHPSRVIAALKALG